VKTVKAIIELKMNIGEVKLMPQNENEQKALIALKKKIKQILKSSDDYSVRVCYISD